MNTVVDITSTPYVVIVSDGNGNTVDVTAPAVADVVVSVVSNVVAVEHPATPTVIVSPTALGGIQSYTHTQAFGATTWVVDHNLGKRPSVTLTDTAGTQFFAAIEYLSADQIRVTLSEPLAGFAYCV